MSKATPSKARTASLDSTNGSDASQSNTLFSVPNVDQGDLIVEVYSNIIFKYSKYKRGIVGRFVYRNLKEDISRIAKPCAKEKRACSYFSLFAQEVRDLFPETWGMEPDAGRLDYLIGEWLEKNSKTSDKTIMSILISSCWSSDEGLRKAAASAHQEILGENFEDFFDEPVPQDMRSARHLRDLYGEDGQKDPPGFIRRKAAEAKSDPEKSSKRSEGSSRKRTQDRSGEDQENGGERPKVSLVRWPERGGDLTDAAAWRETYVQRLCRSLDGLSADGWKALMEKLPGLEKAPRPLGIARACMEWLLDKDRVDDPAGALKAASFQREKEAKSGGGKTALTDADRLRDAALLLAPLLFSDTPLDAASPSVTLQVFIAWQQSEAWLSEVSTDAACRGLAGAEALAAASDGEAMQCYELANESDYGADQGSARVELSGRMRIPLPPETGRANYVGRFADEIVKYLEWIRHPAVDPSETTKWVEEHIRERRAKPPDANINAYLKSRKGRDGMRNYYLALPKPEVESDEDEELLARIAIEVKSRLSYIRIIPIHPAVGPDGIEAHAFDAVEALMIKDKDAKA